MKRILLFIATIIILLPAESTIKTDKEINRLLQKLTIEQKARLLVGDVPTDNACSHIVAGAAGWTHSIDSLGIPSLNLADGPVGIRIDPVTTSTGKALYDDNGIPLASVYDSNQSSLQNDFSQYCTCFPSTTALAATWNPQAAYRQGEVMGDEAVSYGVDVILTPGINIMRNPLCGRNFEYFSEDPVISGKMAAALINGIQNKGIGTSLKHFVANNQQTGKKENDARITQRALREIYLKGFEIAIRESNPWSIMASYNRIAGEYTQANKDLLTTLLRDEWDYNGIAITDWNYNLYRPTIKLINARCALHMPGKEDIVSEIVKGVETGEISEKQLDLCVADILRLAFKSISANNFSASIPDLKKHGIISKDIATESMVLLKNDKEILPIDTTKTIALFGVGAYHTIAGGTGSSNVNKAYIVDIATGLENYGYKIDNKLKKAYETYVASQDILLDKPFKYPEWQKLSYHRVETPEMSVHKATETIKKQAQDNDAAIIVISRASGETSDRVIDNDLNLSDIEQELITIVSEQFHSLHKPVIILLNVCGVIEIASWQDKADAILVTWFPGQESGNAVAEVISGKVSPSGKLPMTLPIKYSDLPSSKNYPYVGQTEGENFDYTFYNDDIWVGYRYFNTTNRPVAYPFGYGLSYTNFEYSNLDIKTTNDKIEVNVDITNTGNRPGAEVAQLYVTPSNLSTVQRPNAELKGFDKTRILKPGESQTIKVTIPIMDLAWFDENNSRWTTDAGTYGLYFGNSVENKILGSEFKIKKPRYKPTLNVLAPVVEVETIDIESLKVK